MKEKRRTCALGSVYPSIPSRFIAVESPSSMPFGFSVVTSSPASYPRRCTATGALLALRCRFCRIVVLGVIGLTTVVHTPVILFVW